MAPRLRRVALACCFLSICLLLVVRMPSKSLLFGIMEVDPQDAERIMMERYAHSLQFKGKVRIKSLATAMDEDRSDGLDMLPGKVTMKERSTTVYFPPACKNGVHWKICRKIVPSFMVAGAEHSGASVLYEAFRTHPQVWDLEKSNEIYERTGNGSILDLPDSRRAPFFGSQYYNEFDPASKNLEWYLDSFPSIKDIPVTTKHNPVLSGGSLPHIQHYGLSHATPDQQESPSYNDQKILVGECAPSYLHMDGVSKRIAATMPEIKAVFILRDPIDRAYLNYLDQKQYAAGYSFEDIVAEELLILKECIARPGSKKWAAFLTCHSEEATKSAKRMGLPLRPRTDNARDPPVPLLNLIVKGLYYSQLHEFVKYVPFTKILVLRTEDLYASSSTVSTMVRLAQFLNLDPAHFVNFPIEIGVDPMSQLKFGVNSFKSGIHVQQQDDGSALLMNSNHRGFMMEKRAAIPDQEFVVESLPGSKRQPGGGSSQRYQQEQQLESAGSVPRRQLSRQQPPTPLSQYYKNNQNNPQNGKNTVVKPADPPLELSTRFRLQRVFEPFNQKLVGMFEHRRDFPGWEYDVDRG